MVLLPDPIVTQAASTMQVQRLNQEDMVAAKRWIGEEVNGVQCWLVLSAPLSSSLIDSFRP